MTVQLPPWKSEESAGPPDAASADALIVDSPAGASRLDLGRSVYCLFGLVFDAVTLDEASEELHRCAAKRVPCLVSTPNVNFVVTALRDAAFRDSVLRSDLCLADGMPIVWAARLMGIPIRHRVAGSDLFEHLRSRKGQPLKVYFFGGPQGVAQRACAMLNAAPDGLRCVGFHSPGFGSIEELSGDPQIDSINASGADFLVVALGASKGQAWIEHNRPRLEAPIVSHLGAVVNFVAGNLRRAPHALRRLGLEWCWRILQEPALWRRYLLDGTVLLRLVLTWVLPCALSLLLRRVVAAPEAPARFEVVADARTTIFFLHGSWPASSLGHLRLEIARRLRANATVQIDLAGVTWVDSSLIGLIALLDVWQLHTRTIVPGGAVRPLVRKMIRRHGADFLLRR
ncbi:MAG: WecB/TagA/CpsF family glycosyltransferase [Burkholderiaceae bacterium]